MLNEEQEQARQQLIDAVKAWREAVCAYPQSPGLVGEQCDGENHLEECPVELARQDLIAAHNKVEQFKAG